MRKISVREARAELSRLDKLLEAEGELTITRRGEPIARIVPAVGKRTMPSHRALRKSLPRMRRGSEQYVREDRDAR